MSLFLTGGRHSLTHSPVPGLKGTVQHAVFGVGKGGSAGRRASDHFIRLASQSERKKQRQCVRFARYKQSVKIYKYILYNF